jgi:hypothetical protein
MKIVSRSLLLAVSLSLGLVGAAEAKSHHKAHGHAAAKGGSWNGTWAGAWGGRDATTITISGNRVVSYTYGGSSTPVSGSRVTAKTVNYTDNGNSVVMVKTGANTANAKLHSSQGDGEAAMTRQ